MENPKKMKYLIKILDKLEFEKVEQSNNLGEERILFIDVKLKTYEIIDSQLLEQNKSIIESMGANLIQLK